MTEGPQRESVEPSKPALLIRGLTKTFGGTVALKSVDLTVRAGEIHGLLGENGSGKSTLIKTLGGYHRPDGGARIEVTGRQLDPGSPESSYLLGCRFVHQDLGLIESESVADNLLYGSGFPTRWGTVRKKAVIRRAREALENLGLDIDPNRLISELSPASKTCVAMARAFMPDAHAVPRLMVLDEATASLPDAEVAILLNSVRRLADAGVGVLYVTHRLEEIFQIADCVTVLRDGENVGAAAIGDLTMSSLVNMLIGIELPELRQQDSSTLVEDCTPAVVVEEISSSTLDSVSLEVSAGEILGVAGLIGSGRDDLLSAIFGSSQRLAGRVTLLGSPVPNGMPAQSISMGMGYLPTNRRLHGGVMTLSARENLTLADLAPVSSAFATNLRDERREVGRWFERLSVRPADGGELPLESFSGGNQQKILLAKWIRTKPKVLLLDEPSQGVDVGAMAEIHREILQLASEGTAVIVSSSDPEELSSICHRVIVLQRGRIAGQLMGAEISARSISNLSHVGAREVA